DRSYELYIQAMSADPGVGVCLTEASRFVTTYYYRDCSEPMLARYLKFLARTEAKIARFYPADFIDPTELAASLGGDACLLKAHLFTGREAELKIIEDPNSDTTQLQNAMLRVFNAALEDPSLSRHEAFRGRVFPRPIYQLMQKADSIWERMIVTRILLERVFWGHSRSCLDERGYVGVTRLIRGESGQTFSLRTTKVVLSYVLNDLGNAYLNYYWQRGGREHIRRAVDVFE